MFTSGGKKKPHTQVAKVFYCVFVGVHVYYSGSRRKAEAFRDKRVPRQEITVTTHPQTYGFPHLIP